MSRTKTAFIMSRACATCFAMCYTSQANRDVNLALVLPNGRKSPADTKGKERLYITVSNPLS